MRLIHIALLAVVSFVFVGFSQYFFVSDSEFWSWNVAYNIDKTAQLQWFWDRPLFYGLLSTARLFDLDVWQTLLISRALMALVGSLVVCLVSLIVLHLTGQRRYAILSIFFLTANMSFVSQAYKIRSDMFSALMVLLGLFLYLTLKRKWIGILVGLLALTTTPKAIFMVLPFTLYLIWNQRDNIPKKPALMVFTAGGVGLFILDLFTGLVSRNAWYLSKIFTGEQKFREFLWLHLKENPFIWLAVISVLVATVLVKNKSATQKNLLGLVFYFIGFLLIFPEPISYLIAAVFSLIAVGVLGLLFSLQPKKIYVNGLIGVAFLGSIATIATWTIRKNSSLGLADQVQFFSKIDSFMYQHNFKTLYDGTGAMPHRMSHFVFLGANKSIENRDMVRSLTEPFPDVIIGNSRLQILNPELIQLLQFGYQKVAPDIYVRMVGRTHGEKEISDNQLAIKTLAWLSERQFSIDSTQPVFQRTFDINDSSKITQKSVLLKDYLSSIKNNPVTLMFPQVNFMLHNLQLSDVYAFD